MRSALTLRRMRRRDRRWHDGVRRLGRRDSSASAMPGARRSRSCRPISATRPASSRSTVSISRSPASAATPSCSRPWRPNAIDIGLGSGPGLAFIVKGSPVKGIAAMAGPPLLFALVVRADGAVKTVDDLKGRKVGVSTVGSADQLADQRGVAPAGLGLRRHRLRCRSATTPRAIAALQAGAVDGCVVDIGSALNFVQTRRRPHPDALRRRGQGFHHPRHLRHRQGRSRSKPDGAARLPQGLVRDHRLHAREQGEDGRDRQGR